MVKISRLLLAEMANSIGYGTQTARNNLLFDGNEEKYGIWECKFLAHMRIKKLKKVIIPDGPAATADQREDQNGVAYKKTCTSSGLLSLVCFLQVNRRRTENIRYVHIWTRQ